MIATAPYRVLTAKFPGTCCHCVGSIRPGNEIAHYGPRQTAHLSCARGEDPGNVAEAELAQSEFQQQLASDRRLARRGMTVVRTSSGWTGTRNARGRCKDAPCCGCCTF